MPGLLDPNTLAGLDHATLYRMRAAAKEKELQNLLAGFEHRAFAREAVADNPLLSVPIGVAAPLYQLSKFAPRFTGNKSRSDPSMEQLGQAYSGVGEGLLGAWRNWRKQQ